MKQLTLSLCHESAKLVRLDLCSIILAADGGVPEWVQLVPAGKTVKALDGRSFRNETPQKVVDEFNADPRDMPIDWEHSTEIKAPEGEEAPASGWIDLMEVRKGGSIWGHVKEWTPRGSESLTTKEYRYLSPSFIVEAKENIVRIISAALTNRPALDMPALASSQETEPMDPETLKLLGLDENATPEQVRSAIAKLMDAKTVDDDPAKKLEAAETELQAAREKLAKTETELANARTANPELDKFVPRSDYDAALARAKTAETENAAREKAAHDDKVKQAVDEALREGKITPASRDYYESTCADASGLEKFLAFCEKQPKICEPTEINKKPIPDADTQSTELTAEQLKIATLCGQTPEQYALGRVQ